VPLDGTGTAVFTTSALAAGSHPIVAAYSGDADNATSSSSALSESVVSIPAPTVATGAAGSVTATGATLNATVNPNGSTTTALFQYSTSPSFTPTVQTTIASEFSDLSGLAVDAAGDVFVAEGPLNAVYEVHPDGTISTVGSGFNLPLGVAVDAAGDVFVEDAGDNAVKEVLPNGTILTVGSGFSIPQDVAVDAAGDVFVADDGNNAVKEVLPDGTITTVGSGFGSPRSVAVDAAGDVFVADFDNNAVKEVHPDGTISTVGSGFHIPVGVAVDAAGDVFVEDGGDNAVYEVLPDGTITTVGSGFHSPVGVAVDAAGDVFVADLKNSRVVELSPPTIAATPSPLTGTAATAVSATLTGLTPGTTYYDRVVATNAGGTVADSTVQSFTTPQAATTTTLTSSANPLISGQPVTFTAVVSASPAGLASPTGFVQFFDNGAPLDSTPVALDWTGTAVFTTSLPPGSQTITASYSGDVSDTPSASAPLSLNVIPNQAATTTSLASSANPSQLNQPVTFTASVASPGPAPTGSVTFSIDGSPVATVALNGAGMASYATGSIAVGGHAVVAVYNGDANDLPSTSPAVQQVVNADGTGVALTVSSTTPVVGQKVTLKATVSVLPPGTGPATGSVTFSVGGMPLGTASLAGGVATLLASLPTAGAGTVTAVYSPGSPSFAPSTSPGVSVSVGLDTTQTSLTVTPATTVVGRATVLRATISVVAPGAGTPTGSVTFYDGTTALGTVPLTAKIASLSETFASPGSHSITAVYSGDSNGNGSTSAASPLTVNSDLTRTTLAAAPTTVVLGQSLVLKATVSAVAPGVGTPTGTVSFYDGATLIGTQPLSASAPYTASITTSTLPIGSAQPITAVYSGDANDLASTSTASKVTVNPVTTRTVVTRTPATAVVGQPMTLIATVSVLAPGVSTPTGSVTFLQGSTTLGTATLAGNTATLPWTFTSAGSQPITAVYSGDTYDRASTAAGPLNVGKDATKTTLTSSATPAVPGQPVTFTATVAVQSPGAGTPTGTVTFKDGATVLGTGSLSGDVATFTTTTLAPGKHSITASYAGDFNDGASASAALSEAIQWTTTVGLTSSSPSGAAGTVTLTATVADVGPGTGTPAGTVSYYYGTNTLIGTATLGGGVAKLKPPVLALPAGSYVIYVIYDGDPTHQGFTSPTITQVIS
jgi:hypothetical protein